MREFSPDRKLLERAEALTEIDRWEEAIPFFSRYLIQEPDSHRANCYLSACFYHLKNSKEALRYAEIGIRFKPDDEWGHRLRSLALSLEKKHAEALVSAKEAVRLAPQEPLAIQRLMNAFLNCGLTKEALREGEKLRSLQPEKEDSFVTMGYILMESKRYKEAEDLFYHALKLNPTSSTALNNLGVIYLRQNKEEKAFEFFHRAIQADPNDKLAQDNLKLTVKYTPIWQIVLLVIAIGIIFPPGLIGLLIYYSVGFGKERRFRKLPPSVQLFLNPKKMPGSFAEAREWFLNSEVTLQFTKVLFLISVILCFIALVFLFIDSKDLSFEFGGNFYIFIISLPTSVALAYFWSYLKTRVKAD